MTVSSYTLVPRTVYGEPSGNYDGSSLDWYSDPVKAVNYYRGQGHLQTINFNLDGFQGLIVIQATLDAIPDLYATVWATVAELGDIDTSSQITTYRPITVAGNFTWLRAHIIDFQDGVINAVTVVY